jgi:hypothetical protein
VSEPGERVWWAPRRRSWWTALLFACGSTCFLVGPFPGFLALVGPAADGAVFFAGSLMFTSAAILQYLDTVKPRVLVLDWHNRDWWSSVVQLVGTVLFNVDTWNAMQDGLSTKQENRLIWAPDAFGSACFLIASYLAWVSVRHAHGDKLDRRIAAVNLLGSVLFGISAIASFYVPSTGDILALGPANFSTAAGAACFLAGALMLFPAGAAAVHPNRAMPSRVAEAMVGE